MIKQTFKLVAFVLLAFLAGVAGSQFGPEITARLTAGQSQSQSPVTVVEKTQITIQENKALKDAIAKVGNTVLTVKSVNSKGKATFGSGLILTSDGLAVTLSSLLPSGSTMEVAAGDKKIAFQVLKRDKNINLALLQLEGAAWPTASFYPANSLKIGERIFLTGGLATGGSFASEGMVRNFGADSIETNIMEKADANGSPVFDIEGNILGIASVDKSGRAIVIPTAAIKNFSDL